MAKRAKKEQIERFRRDFAALRENNSNDDLAKKLNVDPTNLSSYSTGGKNPGLDFINKFYMTFENEIPKSDENKLPKSDENEIHKSENKFQRTEDNGPAPEAEDPSQGYRTRRAQEDLIHTLKFNNEHLWTNFDKIVDTNQTLADSNKLMAESNLILAKNIDRTTPPL